MIKTTKPLLKAVLCCSLAIMSGRLAQAQTYSTGFENPPYTSGAIHGQDSWSVNNFSTTTNMQIRTATEITNILTAEGQIVGDVVHSGTQAYFINGIDASSTALKPVANIPTYGQVSFDLWARPLAPTPGGTNLGNFFVTMESATGTRAAAFRFGFDAATTNAHIDFASAVAGAAVWTNSGTSWTTNTWYHIAFNVNYDAQNYNFFVNGVQLNTNPIPFYTGNNISSFGRWAVVRGANQAGAILDDFNLSSIAPTNPVVRWGTNSPYGWKFRILDADVYTPATNSITVTVDGVAVTPTSILQYGNIGGADNTGTTTVAYDSPTPIFVPGSTHTNVIQFTGSGFSPVTRTIVYTIAPVQGTLDRTHHYFAQFRGSARYGADQSGRTGAPGDYAVDMGGGITPTTTAKVYADDAELLTGMRNAVGNDVMSCSIWVKRRNLQSSSVFWANSPTAPVSGRAFQLHGPYSDDTIYFDTGGGTTNTSRVQTNVTALFPPSFWTNGWHHLVAIKNGSAKQIWVDGQLIIDQQSGAATISGYNDLNLLVLGAASPDSLVVNGLIDDFSSYSTALTPSDVAALYSGTAPNAIPSASSLLNWWDFNDSPDVKVATVGANEVVTFRQTLQSATNVAGPYTDVPNATSPYTNSAATQLFFRARK